MHDRAFALLTHGEAAALEHLEHWGVLAEDLRDELAQTRFAPDRRQALQERPAEALPLVVVDHQEPHLGASWRDNHIAAAADNGRATVFRLPEPPMRRA